jgi:peptide-methionine (S)-S-oxide reductase
MHEAAVYYDPKVISFKELVNVFSRHRPDNSNQQRARFFLSLYCLIKNAAEKKIIEDKIKELTANKVFANPIVTEVKPVTDFMKQDYHQDYVKHNPNQPYVKGVSVPIQQV